MRGPPRPTPFSPDEQKRRIKRVKRARQAYQRAISRKFQKVRRMINDIHRKTANWVCSNYSTVLLPEFESSRMVRKQRNGKRIARKINKKTVRGMLTWSHYAFRQRLLHRAKRSPGCEVIICDEAYTSKACGKCGKTHEKLGGNKVFKCPQPTCDHVACRDGDAARKILIRFLTINHIPLP